MQVSAAAEAGDEPTTLTVARDVPRRAAATGFFQLHRFRSVDR
jgi:hypothetical protein